MEKKKKRRSSASVGSNVVRKKPANSRNSRKVRPAGSKVKRNKNGKEKKKMSKIKKFFIIVALLLVLAVLVCIGIFCGIFFSDKFALSREDLLLSNANTVVYDRDGNVIAELSGTETRKIISYDQMSKHLPDAFVAIEDERFYQHKGVDFKRTLAATTTYLAKGDSSFGGSTITQQLIKNITNERENSGSAGVERKIKEMSRAYQVEKMISKKQILELYLNIIPLGADGGDICGVEMAATYYFNKSASDLSIEECAFIAGINNAPNTYNPFKNAGDAEKQAQVMKKVKDRTQVVLRKMKELKFITEDEFNTAYKNAENLNFQKGELPSSTIKDYFIEAAVDNVVNDLVEKKGMTREYAKNRVYGGGYKIYTTEVGSVQSALYETYTAGEYELTSRDSDTHSQSAMVVIDHTTGQVVGCMGGLGTDVDAIGINRAVDTRRQTGSSIKPIATYGCGVEKRIITPATVYNDEKTYFGNWDPKNDSGGFSGYINVRNAIERSVNIVACKIMSEIGPDNAIDFCRQCGITSLVKASEDPKSNDSNLAAMALGGQTKGVSVLEMAGAYAMIANNGVYISPTFYTKVEDSSGNIVIEAEQKTERVMTEQHAYIMKTLLKQPVEGGSGTARVCRMDDFDVGAKTGTTNQKKDNWLCGMTAYYTAASWYGYDDGTPINGSGNNAAKLWATAMKKIHQDLAPAEFAQPSGIVRLSACRTTGQRASSSCSDTYMEYFVEGEEPSYCQSHSSVKVCRESGMVATENCPDTYYFSFAPEKERNPSWKTEGAMSSAPSETCTIHANGPVTNVDPGTGTETPVTTTDITVPNVVGMSEESARQKLAGLTVVTKQVESDKPKGTVVSQSFGAGSVVEKNAKITISISKGPAETPAEPTTPTEPTEPTEPEVQTITP